MTKQLYVLVAAAMLMPASAAVAHEVGTGAIEGEHNAANGVQSHREFAASRRIIWRKPEIRPLTWEEQRVFDRSSRAIYHPTKLN